MIMDFLFHKVSEEEREKIKNQAKEIMEGFSEKLEKVKSKIPEPLIERKEFERMEKSSTKNVETDFRKRMFENAPNKNKDFIIAEKKKW